LDENGKPGRNFFDELIKQLIALGNNLSFVYVTDQVQSQIGIVTIKAREWRVGSRSIEQDVEGFNQLSPPDFLERGFWGDSTQHLLLFLGDDFENNRRINAQPRRGSR
jgi:hypothetical protein